MRRPLISILKLISYIPFMEYFFRIFYFSSLKKIKNQYAQNPDIKDIFLTTDMKSPNFLYGLSDLNVLIIVNNSCHPKKLLNEFRDFISKSIDTNLTLNTEYVPILTEEEFHIPQVKSFLIRNTYKEVIEWKSILKRDNLSFKLTDIEHSAVAFSAMQNLDFYLFKSLEAKTPRIRVKNIHRDLVTLQNFYPKEIRLNKNWKRLGNWTQGHPFLNYIFYQSFIKKTWIILTQGDVETKIGEATQTINISNELQSHLESLLELNFIKDITLTPSIIQNDLDNIKGKLFIEIHITDQFIRNYYTQLNNIKDGFEKFESKNLKFRIRIVSPVIYKLQNEHAYYPFPLDSLFRDKVTVSIAGNNYKYQISQEDIIKSSIYFLTSQFIRFRSLEQKTDLIGSKFIKSLNLMYRYFLLLEFLKKKQFHFQHNEKLIREHLTPQFSEIKMNDRVTEEDWTIIRAQLIYLLKEIRDELVPYNKELKNLKF
jgi:hypothetical protein